MTRERLEKYISEEYNANGEHLWAKYPGHEVFRHAENRKWFAVLMNISEDKLTGNAQNGISQKAIDVLDVKCDPILASSFLCKKGFYQAYHMNKVNWLSIAIERVDEEKIKLLLDMSYELTKPKGKKTTTE